MAEFQTTKVEIVDYGRNNFIEIALKIAIDDQGKKNPFISISKGWYPQGAEGRRYRQALGFPAETELINKFEAAVEKILKESKSVAVPAGSGGDGAAEQ